MKSDVPRPSVGVAAVIWRDSDRQEFLLGLGHNANDIEEVYAMPGGHWESGESLHEAIVREIQEEAGVEVTHASLISLYEFFNIARGKSYLTVGFETILKGGEIPTVVEAENKKNWGWYSPSRALELPLFEPDRVLIERSLSGVLHELHHR